VRCWTRVSGFEVTSGRISAGPTTMSSRDPGTQGPMGHCGCMPGA
jgi:hypothetical protein